jgi:tRNA threonylcarbamoyl adenosine modification protein YeaZ
MTANRLIAIDTATTSIVVAIGSTDGELLAADAFEGRYRHSQELLPAVVRLLDANGLRPDDLAAVIVGTGPGAFTGLRVGIATAKTLAHELGRPIVGVGTDAALLAAASVDGQPAGTLWLPSGARDLVRIRAGQAVVVHGAGAEAIGPEDAAVDLEGRAPESAVARGRAALERLPASLIRLGAARLAVGERDDPERLVPRYASPPRGMPAGQSEGGVAWSRDPR